MSSKVEERIVSMEFDNRQFEQGVSQSLGSLDKLESKLQFKGVDSAFAQIDRAAANVDMSPIVSATEAAAHGFSVLEVAGITAVSRLTNDVISKAERMAKSLSVDQITAGWNKYASMTTSVQTIMSATNKLMGQTVKMSDGTEVLLEDQQTQMEWVQDYISKLNWFSDETSYSLTDMTDNIGKFISAGVGLDTAQKSMQGIATWAALSGQNSQAATRAMYNLSQAMGSGVVRLQDWKSIENANMATIEFKEQALEAGVALGTLTKKAEGVYETVESGVEVTTAAFNDSLSEKWFTGEVLTKALDAFGGFSTELSKYYEDFSERGIDTTSELLKIIEEYKNAGDDFERKQEIIKNAVDGTDISLEEMAEMVEKLGSDEYDLGYRAMKAAQEAKTFSEAIDATADAVSTAWMNIFQNIFGNYLEAKKLWTDLANALWDIFAGPLDGINSILSDWNEAGGRTKLWEAIYAALSNVSSVIGTIKKGFSDIFPELTANKLLKWTNSFAIRMDSLSKWLNGTNALWDDLSAKLQFRAILTGMANDEFKNGETRLEKLGNAVRGIADVIATVEKTIEFAVKMGMQALRPIFTIATEIIDIFLDVGSAIGKAISGWYDSTKYFSTLDSIFTKFKTSMDKTTKFIHTAFKTVRVKVLEFIINWKRAWLKATESVEFVKLTGYLNKFKETIVGIYTVVKDYLIGALTNLNTNLLRSDGVEFLTNAFIGLLGAINWLIDGIIFLKNNFQSVFKEIKTQIENFVKFINDKTGVQQAFTNFTQNIKEAIHNGFTGLADYFKSGQWLTDLANIGDALTAIGDIIIEGIKQIDFEAVYKSIVKFKDKLVSKFKETFNKITWSSVIGTLKQGSFLYILFNIGRAITNVVTGAGSIKDGIKNLFESLEDPIKNLGDLISSYSLANKADAAKEFAKALAIMTGCIVILSAIDQEKAQNAVEMITMMGLVVGGFAAVLVKLNEAKANKFESKAVAKLSDIGRQLKKGLQSIGHALAIAGTLIGGAAILGSLAIVIKMVGDTIEKLNGIKEIKESTLIVLGAIATCIGLLFTVVEVANNKFGASSVTVNGDTVTKIKNNVWQAALLVGSIGLAMKMVADAAVTVSDMEWTRLASTLGTMAGIIGALELVVMKWGSSSLSSGIGNGLGLMAAAYSLKIMFDILEKVADRYNITEILSKMVNSIVDTLSKLDTTSMGILGLDFVAFTVMLNFLTQFNYSLGKLSPTITSVALCIGAVSAAIAVVVASMPTFVEYFEAFLDTILNNTSKIIAVVGEVLSGIFIALFAKEHMVIAKLVSFITAVISGLSQIEPEVVDKFITMVFKVIEQLAGYTQQISDMLFKTVITIVDSLSNSVEKYGPKLIRSFSNLWANIKNVFAKGLTEILGIDKETAKSITNVAGNLALVGGAAKVALGGINKLNSAGEKSSSTITTWMGKFNTVKVFIKNIAELGSGAIGVISKITTQTGIFFGLLQSGTKITTALSATIGGATAASGLLGGLTAVLGILGPITLAVGGVYGAIKLADHITESTAKKMYGLTDAAKEAISSSQDTIDNFNSLFDNISEINSQYESDALTISKLAESYDKYIQNGTEATGITEANAKTIKEKLADALNVTEDELGELVEKYGSAEVAAQNFINTQLRGQQLEKLQETYNSMSESLDEYDQRLNELANNKASQMDTVVGQLHHFYTVYYEELAELGMNSEEEFMDYMASINYDMDQLLANSNDKFFSQKDSQWYKNFKASMDAINEIVEAEENLLASKSFAKDWMAEYDAAVAAMLDNDYTAMDEHIKKMNALAPIEIKVDSDESLSEQLNNGLKEIESYAIGANAALRNVTEDVISQEEADRATQAFIDRCQNLVDQMALIFQAGGKISGEGISEELISAIDKTMPEEYDRLLTLIRLNPDSVDAEAKAMFDKYQSSILEGINTSNIPPKLKEMLFSNASGWSEEAVSSLNAAFDSMDNNMTNGEKAALLRTKIAEILQGDESAISTSAQSTFDQWISEFYGAAEASAGAGSVSIGNNGNALSNVLNFNIADIANAGSEEYTSTMASNIADDTSVGDAAVSNMESAAIEAGTVDSSEAGTGFIGTIATAMSGVANKISDASQSAMKGGKISASKVSTWDVGRNFSIGLAQGILNGTNVVADAARKIAKKAKETLKSELDVNSPSREAAKIGNFFGLGFAQGIDNSSNSVMNSVTDMAKSTLDALSDPMAQLAAVTEEDFNLSPVISPVLDLSSIQNGNQTISDMLGIADSQLSMYARGINVQTGTLDLNETINSALSGAIDDLMNRRSEERQNINITVPFTVDGRQFAKATATYTREEINKIDTRNSRKKGIL